MYNDDKILNMTNFRKILLIIFCNIDLLIVSVFSSILFVIWLKRRFKFGQN